MKTRCVDHLDFAGEVCPECGLPVNEYGNTEAQPIDYCSFPDCGCDGARLCMAGIPSEASVDGNVEGMWSGKTKEQRLAVFKLLGMTVKNKK